MSDLTTIDGSTAADGPTLPRHGLTLTVLWHPDPRRIGIRSTRAFPGGGGALQLSRTAPAFEDGQPLDDPRTSRTPLQLTPDGRGGLHIFPGKPGQRFSVEGEPGRGAVSAGALDAGVVLALGKGVRVLVERAWWGRAARDHGLVGTSRGLEAVRQAIDRAAPISDAVLVQGPSGTGKELIARALHRASRRAAAPFVALNLAAVPTTTAVSQLFGHRRGAFTGADRSSAGAFGQAEGGTLLLDEIGACPSEIQAMLLRALEVAEVQPVGGAVRTVDVRILASTDEDLDRAIADRRFTAPLYYRLAEERITVPPLCERRADIAVQAVYFADEALREAGRPGCPEGWLSATAMDMLLAWSWPGNTRELRAVVRRLARTAGASPTCGAPDLRTPGGGPGAPAPVPTAAEPTPPLDVEAALLRNDHELRATARELCIGINTLRRRMAALGMPRPRDLDAATIRRALDEADSFEAAARHLRVSARGLRLRAGELGLPTG